MTISLTRREDVVRPSLTPLRSSVLDHAKVRTQGAGEAFGWRNDEGLWLSYSELNTLTPYPDCENPVSDARTRKTFGRGRWVPGYTTNIYGGVMCENVGLDVEDMETELRKTFELNEGKGIERSLLLNRFVEAEDTHTVDFDGDGDVENVPLWSAPIDVTPQNATNVSLPLALASLESWYAANYPGRPTIHMPMLAFTLLGSDKIVWDGDLAYTRSGSKVAIGGGYDSQDRLEDGDVTMYATGEVYVEKGELIKVTAAALHGDGLMDLGASFGYTDNTRLALVERQYRIAVDGPVISATGKAY